MHFSYLLDSVCVFMYFLYIFDNHHNQLGRYFYYSYFNNQETEL